MVCIIRIKQDVSYGSTRIARIDLDQKIPLGQMRYLYGKHPPMFSPQYELARAFTAPRVTLDQGALQSLADLIDLRAMERKMHLLEAGEVSRHLIVVQSGMLRQFYLKNGKEVTEHFAVEGQAIWCIESLFLGQPSQLVVEVLEDGIYGLVPYAALKEKAREHPGFFTLLTGMLEGSLVLSQRKADSWKFESARERYDRFLEEYPEASRRASINHIASYLLLTPETVSRVRAGKL
jgi:CRP-like cAMP-binding protein